MSKKREFVPHPGSLPTAEQALARWVRPGMNGTKIGEVPYEHYADRSLNGLPPFREQVGVRPGESHATLVRRIMDSGDLGVSAAHVVALRLEGYAYLREGRKVVHNREVLEHRDSAVFHSDPTPMRGKIEACVSPDAFRTIKPSVAVNLSALRSLRWSPNLRPTDLLLLWILIGCASAEKPIPTTAALKKTFRISRPWDAVRRLQQATYSVIDDPDLPEYKWTRDRPVLVNGALDYFLLDHIRPVARGENYAYLELSVVALLTASWQEQALRGLLAGAVRTRCYWSDGGRYEWELSINEAAELFALGSTDLARLRKERLSFLMRLLERTQAFEFDEWRKPYYYGSRIQFSYTIHRNARLRGRPADTIVLDVTYLGSAAPELPKSAYAKERTQERAKTQSAEMKLAGLDKALTETERKEKRSAAAKKGWDTRRCGQSVAKRNARPKPPRRPKISELPSSEDILYTAEAADDREASPEAPRTIEVSPEELYGYLSEEGYIADWDDLVQREQDDS